MNDVNNTKTTLFVYRQVQVALGLSDVSRQASETPDKADFLLHKEGNSSNGA
jgi:hypothetical protein